ADRGHAGHVAPRPGKALDDPGSDRVGMKHEHNRRGRHRLAGEGSLLRARHHDEIWSDPSEIGGKSRRPLAMACPQLPLQDDGLAFDVSESLEKVPAMNARRSITR